MTSRVPRKQRNLKGAALAAENASVEVGSSNCEDTVTLEAVNQYELFGFGNSLQTYTQGESTDFASEDDFAKQTNGKDANGVTRSIKDANNLIQRSNNAGLATNGNNFYFNTTQTSAGSGPRGGLTGSTVLGFVYGKNGPQAPYIPQLVHQQDGLSTGTEYVFFLPSVATGTNGLNMPTDHSRSFEVTVAGAVAPGESVVVYTADDSGVRTVTGSAFTYSASFCSEPNYSKAQVRILTGSIQAGNPATSQAGIVVVYSASYTEDGTKENTPYAGVTVTINPSALITSNVEAYKKNYPHMLLCMWVFLCLKNKTIELVQTIILASLES